jgi:hypothetical protein
MQQSPIAILPKFFADRFSLKMKLVFAGLEGVLWVWLTGSFNGMRA